MRRPVLLYRAQGKTDTTEFASFSANSSHNPHDPSRTPGGSSSGSAAAVADMQVPIALGTQTNGSVIRPAGFCGVCGFKGSYGLVDCSGIFCMVKEFDTLGYYARCGRFLDMRVIWLHEDEMRLCPLSVASSSYPTNAWTPFVAIGTLTTST